MEVALLRYIFESMLRLHTGTLLTRHSLKALKSVIADVSEQALYYIRTAV